MNQPLLDKIAVVCGASRGCGRGIALALGEAGATVYATGRTTRTGPKPADGAPGCIEDTAEEVTRRGGTGIPLPVDHTDAAQVECLFDRVRENHGRLDILACAVWGGNERYLDPVWQESFWKQPAQAWRECLDAGPHAFWLAARYASPIMVEQGSGLIVVITEPILEQAFEGQHPSLAETFWHFGHYCTNRLVKDLANAAKRNGIAVIGLLPGFMRTERVEMHLESMGPETREQFRYDLAESTEYSGRAISALATDPDVLNDAGKLLYVGDLAEKYGFTDIDGKRVANFYKALGLI